ncbi:MAG: hypothetical protein ACE5FC_07885 [Myxococcota bacterium]
MPLRRALPALVLALVLMGADAPPLEPDFQPAAPEGWLVAGKGEGSYTWLRFSVSEAAEGEDYRDDAITLYRIPIAVPPWKAGEALVETKLRVQDDPKSEPVTRTIEGVLWKGITAAYVSGAGTPRRERYLYTGHHKDNLYVFWDRGPAEGWEAGAAVREEALRKVSAILAGRFEAKPDEGEGAENAGEEAEAGDGGNGETDEKAAAGADGAADESGEGGDS